MKQIVSRYVREQKRYTKKDLRDIFVFDENGVEQFIKSLKAFGIIKSVKYGEEQLEMSDLVDGDIDITDVIANDECLYVFTYVGVITCGRRIIKVYPKYLLSYERNPNAEPLDEMKQVVKVLEKYSNSQKQIINVFNGDGDYKSFNVLGVILFLLNDFYEYGIYTNSEDIIELNGEGDILWGKTIDESFVVIENNRPYYMELYTSRSIDDDLDYFKRLHEFVLTDCSKQLHDAELDVIFGLDSVELSEERLLDFGDIEYILERILKELNVQFNTRRQILLKTIYAYISQNKRMIDDNEGISMFGTTAYHAVWERVCAEVLGNKLDKSLKSLGMNQPMHVDCTINNTLIEIIEKPTWHRADFVEKSKETLRPDLISFFSKDDKKYFIIFDAKYYNLVLEKNKLSGNPGVGDISKQYLYQLAYRIFIEQQGFSGSRNCFLMPTEEDEIVDMGYVSMKMLHDLNLEDIQIRKLPARKMYEKYLSNHRMDIELLELV